MKSERRCVYESQFKSLWSRGILDHNVVRRLPGGLDPCSASESVKQNSLLSLPSTCLISANLAIVPRGNDSRPLQFPLQLQVRFFDLAVSEKWRVRGDSNSRPSGS